MWFVVHRKIIPVNLENRIIRSFESEENQTKRSAVSGFYTPIFENTTVDQRITLAKALVGDFLQTVTAMATHQVTRHQLLLFL